MGYAKQQLAEQAAAAAEEYRLESLCPKCGDEREEVTYDHNTFWLCDGCDGNADERDAQYEIDNPIPDHVLNQTSPEDDDLWGLGGKNQPAPPKNDVVMVPVPRALAKDVIQGLAERIWYHVDGLKDNPLDAACLADVNTLTAFVKKLQTLFPEVDVEF